MRVYYTPNQALLDAEFIRTGKRSGPLGLRRYVEFDETALTPAQRTKILAYERSGMRTETQTIGAILLGNFRFVEPRVDPKNGVLRGLIAFDPLMFYIAPEERDVFEILDSMLIQYERCKALLAKSDSVWETMKAQREEARAAERAAELHEEADDLVDEIEHEYTLDESDRVLRPRRELLWTLVELLSGKELKEEGSLYGEIRKILHGKG
jgi:hypothetical protein